MRPPVDLLNLTRSELEAFVVDELRQPRFRADQLWHWLWLRGVRDFSAMTNLSKDLKAKLATLPVVDAHRYLNVGWVMLPVKRLSLFDCL